MGVTRAEAQQVDGAQQQRLLHHFEVAGLQRAATWALGGFTLLLSGFVAANETAAAPTLPAPIWGGLIGIHVVAHGVPARRALLLVRRQLA